MELGILPSFFNTSEFQGGVVEPPKPPPPGYSSAVRGVSVAVNEMCLCNVKNSMFYCFYTRKEMGVESELYVTHILLLMLLYTYLLTTYTYLCPFH
jgi:hypothetical protein